MFVMPPPVSQGSSREKSWELWQHLCTYDHSKTIYRFWEMVVFVARYASQDISVVEKWPTSKLIRVYRIIVSFLKEESRKGAVNSPTGGDGSW